MSSHPTGTGSRRVVVTGAASGIGAALAARLVAAGHEVIGVDRAPATIPDGAVRVTCDLADPASVAAAVGEIDGIGAGPLHGLAAVAGVPGTAPPETVYAVNLLGLRRLTEALLPRLADGGAIVLLSSMAGYRGTATDEEAAALVALPDDVLAARLAALGLAGPEAYQLSKQLVQRYALDLAARLHPRAVRATSISPGPVQTPILADFRATMPSLDVAAELVGRHARPEEVAAVVEFALSPEASWLNGVDLRLDGGLTALRSTTATR
ncbi:SDR family oxidoreductase [Pseudonocardia broussonetiae]|uniref:SDR family oxidoreductase n=1 Tax=Pseudonocardia broussonetiae TaxID=2736640 RepID=A0A6M6JMG9_9PSEU|nr:SDR family oxidoreductase [Pseudonocardia broussonetiae]QJY47491.1 SDR family oxidoreductase [Pseudonocardia broussonetiae]